MHSIYKTSGLILYSRNVGEAGKSFEILTQDLGLVRAKAEGVRLQKSKLCPHLREYCLSKIALVHGKTGWRITDAIFSRDYFLELKSDKEKWSVAGNSLFLLRRLLPGEERNETLFSLVKEGLDYFMETSLTSSEIRAFETIFVLRILRNLGYVGESDNLSPFIYPGSWDLETLRRGIPFRKEAVREINKSLKESNL